MEELLNQMRELVNNWELQARREAWSSNNSAREMPFQQLENSYPQEHYYNSAQDQVNFQNSDFVPDFQNSAHGDTCPDFQQQESTFYPQPYAQSQNEHGYYPHSYPMSYQQEEPFLDYQPWSNEPEPPLSSEEAVAAILEALKPNPEWFIKREEEEKEFTSWIQEAGSSWRCSEVVVEDNREEKRNALAMVDQEQELNQEAEKLETSTRAELKFRIGEELNEEETELIFSLLSVHYQDEIQQEKAEEKVEKELNADLDSSLRMKGKEATARYDFTCADFDSLLQGKHYVLQHGESENQEKEGEKEERSFPHSPLLHRNVEKDVEDFTCEDSDHLLHEEIHTMAAQFQLHEEKQEEEAEAPSLLEMKAAEPLYPQSTTPRHQEEEAENFVTSENSPFDFKLTSNQFLLVVNELVSGGELHSKQLNLNEFCKLQPKVLYGEVCKRGANGDGVVWNIKVHPP